MTENKKRLFLTFFTGVFIGIGGYHIYLFSTTVDIGVGIALLVAGSYFGSAVKSLFA